MEKRNFIYCVFSGEFMQGHKITNGDKLDWVWFYDYSKLIGEILSQMSYSEIQKLRLEIYKKYKNFVVFTRFSRIENAINGTLINDGYKVSSGIFKLPISVFAQMLPRRVRVQYFNYDKFYEKYVIKTDFIYYL